MNVEQAEQIVGQFKTELAAMKKEAKPGDTMPAEVFFAFMDVLVPVLEEMSKQLKEDADERKRNS